MKKYKVTLESSDGHTYEVVVEALGDKHAQAVAKNHLEEIHWDIYNYELKQLERLL